MVRSHGGSVPARYVASIPSITAELHVDDTAALREVRPPGRTKLEMWPEEKRQGSNEWISDYIFMMTGKVRTRKQVSSHIQVLKKFLIHIAECRATIG
jgi:PhoPQ-activated pathogenicity-related protein